MSEKKKPGYNLPAVRTGTQFSTDNQPAQRGRPKKLQNQLKDLFRNPDLSPAEKSKLKKAEPLLECFLAKDTWLEVWVKMLELPEDKLKKIVEDKSYPIGFTRVAEALLEGSSSGFLNMLTVFSRKYGTPHNPVTGGNLTINQNKIDFHNSEMTEEQASKMFLEMVRNQ